MKSRKPRTLADLQTQFLSEVIKSDSSPDYVRGHFHIYQDAYRLRIRDTIEDYFSKSLSFLKSDVADSLFNSFFERSFSSSFTLSTIGFVWTEFVKNYVSENNSILPQHFAELTRFEWDLTVAMYRNSNIGESEKSLSLDTLTLHLAPALSIFETKWPVHRIYESANYDSIEQQATPFQIAVWRDGEESRFIELTNLSAQLLKVMIASKDGHVPFESIGSIEPGQIELAFNQLTQMGILRI